MKETSEAIIGLVVLGKELLELSKDGIQANDAVALAALIAKDEAFRNKLVAAVQGCEKIPAELTPVTIEKVIALVVAISQALK